MDPFNPNRRSVIMILMMTGTLNAIATAIVSPALPAIQANFSDVPQADLLVRLVLTLPALFIVLSAPFSGLLTDRVGRKPVLIGGLLLYGLAGGSGFFASTLAVLLVGRALLGVAVAGVLTSATTLIADYYQGEKRARVLGWQGAFIGVVGALTLLVAGYLAGLGWRNVFLIYLIALVILPFAATLLKEPARAMPSGAAAQQSVLQPVTLRLILIIYAIMIAAQVLYFISPVQIPFLMAARTGVPQPQQSGMAIAVLALAVSVGSLISYRSTIQIGRAATLILGLALVGTGYALVGRATYLAMIFIAMAIVGFALGLWLPLLNVWLAEVAPESLRGRALGGMTTARYLGQFMSPILLQPLVSRYQVGPTLTIVGLGALGVALISLLSASGHKLANGSKPRAEGG